MAFGNTTRRSSFGGSNAGSSNTRGGQPTRGGAGQQGGGQAPRAGQGGDRPRNSWTNIATLYDPWHSAMEMQVVADNYGSSFAVKLSPVFADKAGPEVSAAGERKYNYDDNVVIVMKLDEVIMFREQVRNFVAGNLRSVVNARSDTKRIILEQASTYYDENDPNHAGGLVVSIEQDRTDKTDERVIVFISRPVEFTVSDDAEAGVATIYPEIEALLAALDSFVGNIARVDYAATRLLTFGGGSTERAPAASAPQPTRRGGGLSGGPAARTGGASAAPAAAEGGVSDDDIGNALGGASAASASDIDSALGDAPQF